MRTKSRYAPHYSQAFFQHDILHGVFHLDKGMLFTIKETFIRPGKAALDYINGKRISYYNIFYLLLILLGINLLAAHYLEENSTHAIRVKTSRDGTKIIDFINANIKYIILSFIPLFAFNGLVLFKRLKLNFAEHHIIAGFVLLGCAMMILIKNMFGFLPVTWRENFFEYFEIALTVCYLAFPAYVYYMAFAKSYSFYGFLIRICLLYFLFIVEILILFAAIMLFVSKGSFEGEIVL